MVSQLAVSGLCKTFAGVVALDDVSITVEPGEIRALLGENGAGNSTLGKIIAGIHPQTAGSVLIDGREVRLADDVVRKLAVDGVSVIYVSHRMAEIFALCHRVSVLKDGGLAATRDVATTTTDDLIRLMVGRDVHMDRDATECLPGPVVLDASRVATGVIVRDASVTVRADEICLAGLIGLGRSELCETIFGARKRTGGTIAVSGKTYLPSGTWDAKAGGIGIVPEDRKTSGLFPGMDLAHNTPATVMGKVSDGARFS